MFSSGFSYAKSVAAKLVDCLTIDSDEIRVGMITFSSTVSSKFLFDFSNDKSKIKSEITGAHFRNHIRTYTNLPLEHSLNIMTTNPPDTLDIIIVLTDGLSYTNVQSASSALHTAGVYVFAMGVGALTDPSNLASIARNPDADYNVLQNDFFDLHRKVSRLINGLCTGKTCGSHTPFQNLSFSHDRKLQQ